ncbi:NAD(P)/FAD-dependent oxidoreductase [Nocardioides lentus]|uniref:NAD(P)/FAD-dependent oxidoreductase n=2 Tax=Nocardioides lentus TaxID=338077 RepID=A0ABN2PIH9_9ACTN
MHEGIDMRAAGSTQDRYDAVVVGDGINGAVAAAELAGHGWSVALAPGLEPDGPAALIGATAPGFVHDVPSLWHALFRAGPSWPELGPDLQRFGLQYLVAEGPATAVVGEAGVVLGHRDPGDLADDMPDPHQRATYRAAAQRTRAVAPRLVESHGAGLSAGQLLHEGPACPPPADLLPPAEACAAGRPSARLWGPLLARVGVSSRHPRARLVTPMLAHVVHDVGLPVVRGGADCFLAALDALLDDRRVERVPGPLERVEVDGERAVAVHVGGRRLEAVGSVIGALDATTLTGLLDARRPPTTTPTDGPGRGTSPQPRSGRSASVEVHLALARPLAWCEPALDAVPLVHVEREDGPCVAVSQPSVLDPTRAPAGAATAWVSVPLPGTADPRSVPDPAEIERATASALDAVGCHVPRLRASVVGCRTVPTPAPAPPDPALVADYRPLPSWRPGAGGAFATGTSGLYHVGAYRLPRP